MRQWYVRRGDRQFGPYSDGDFQRLLSEPGRVLSDDLVWTQQLPTWVSAAEVLQRMRPAAGDTHETQSNENTNSAVRQPESAVGPEIPDAAAQTRQPAPSVVRVRKIQPLTWDVLGRALLRGALAIGVFVAITHLWPYLKANPLGSGPATERSTGPALVLTAERLFATEDKEGLLDSLFESAGAEDREILLQAFARHGRVPRGLCLAVQTHLEASADDAASFIGALSPASSEALDRCYVAAALKPFGGEALSVTAASALAQFSSAIRVAETAIERRGQLPAPAPAMLQELPGKLHRIQAAIAELDALKDMPERRPSDPVEKSFFVIDRLPGASEMPMYEVATVVSTPYGPLPSDPRAVLMFTAGRVPASSGWVRVAVFAPTTTTVETGSGPMEITSFLEVNPQSYAMVREQQRKYDEGTARREQVERELDSAMRDLRAHVGLAAQEPDPVRGR